MYIKKAVLFLAVLLGITLLIFGCNRAEKVISPDTKVETPKPSTVDDVQEEIPEEEIETIPSDISDSNSDTLLPFKPDECNVYGIRLDMEINDVKAILHEPDSESKESNEALGGDTIFLYYPSLELRFDPYIGEDNNEGHSLASIMIKSPDIAGPRELKVGDNPQSVLDKFPNENHAIEDGMQVLYGGDYDLMEHGYIYYDENDNIEYISYLYGAGGFGTYALNYYIEEAKVKEIEISVANI